MVLFFYACKKETCPAPIPGKVTDQVVIGEYGACLETELTINHSFGPDSAGEIDISVFDTLTTKPLHGEGQTSSTIDSISVNGLDFPTYGFWYYYNFNIDSTLLAPSNHFANFCKSINYKIRSPKYGVINYIDNSAIPSFTNFNAIPLTFSNSSPYILTLSGVANCNLITAYIYYDSPKNISLTNSTTKFYASEFFNTAVGQKLSLTIKLISDKDTIISGCKIKSRKTVYHCYQLTCVP